MKKIALIVVAVLILGVFLIAGCTKQDNDAMMDEKDDSMMEHDVMEENDSMMEENDSLMMDDHYQGEILAGSTTPYIVFNKEDYDKAIDENKIILLYFYANWCPICLSEQKEVFAAFDELNREDVIGFRVNYRDSDVDDFEEELAKEHGITYQHTKVIIQNGEDVGITT